MADIIAIMTCYNRKKKTVACIQSLKNVQKTIDLTYVVVDDKSTDGTKEELDKMNANGEADIIVVEGTGNLFWSKGMNLGMSYVKQNHMEADFYLLLNDDVDFFEESLVKMYKKAIALCGQTGTKDRKIPVLVGATLEPEGGISYGGILYEGGKSLHYRMVGPDEPETKCDTFNANCVLIPEKIFHEIPDIDGFYKHSLGDFDYGFQISHAGYPIYVFEEAVGVCANNAITGCWTDKALSRRERLRLKETPKGLPRDDWFHYLNKNFGFGTAVFRSITPYIKILLKK